MKKQKIKIILALVLAFSWLAPQAGFAQFDNTLYHLRPAVQSQLSNPAFIPDFQYHFGVPALSSVYGQLGTSGVKFNQIFERRSDDSMTFNFDKITSKVKNKNNISARFGIQWLNGGYKWKDYYFTLSISDYMDWNMFYADDIVNLAVNGNAPYIGQTLQADPTYLKYTHYREYAFGAAWDFDSQWNFGARVKMLFGKSNITTDRLNASLHTAENTYYITTENDIMINTSMPSSWFDGSEGGGVKFNGDYLFYGGSFGLGLDLGATYKLDDQFSFSASVLDFGYMKFDRNYINYSSDNVKWTFEGIDPLQFDGMTDDQINDRIENIGDSLLKKFNIQESWNSYNIMMTAKIYLAATYKLSNIEKVGAVLRSEIINNTWRPAFTATYYRQIMDDLGVIGSYTIANRSFANFGVGAYYNYAPVQVYLVTDNIAGIFVPDMVKYATIHFGVNIFMPQKKSGNTLIDF
jgi:hypothetical protein